MDKTGRMAIIRSGIALEAAGVLGALVVLWLLTETREHGGGGGLPVQLLVAMVGCGVVEGMGALISSVAVKKDWVPTVWDVSDPMLSTVNTWMANIDLLAEIGGPLAAGVALQSLGSTLGFVAVGVANVASFGVELALLGAVLARNPSLSAPKPPSKAVAGTCGPLGAFVAGWPIFVSQPSGVPLLVVSYSLLYFTVLSPHGVVLTAYLQTRGIKPPYLAAFRAVGALAGVGGMASFRVAATRGMRGAACLHLWVLGVAVAAAAASFYATLGTNGLSSPMLGFLMLICVSRFGLYGFDLANLQLQQTLVDEALRGSVGAVESSICSLGTGSVFIGTLLTTVAPDPTAAFDTLVYASAGFVGSATLLFTCWYMLHHEHAHEHPLLDHSPGVHSHSHTTQQMRALEESEQRVHTHLHYHPPWGQNWRHLRGLPTPAGAVHHDVEAHSHAHAHAQSHG